MSAPTPPEDLLPIDAQAEFGPAFMMPTTEEPEAETDAFADIETEVDQKVRQDFVGLTYLGRLEETCQVAGHSFLLRTPSQTDRLEMGPLHKPYLNTVSTEPAWRVLTVAAYLRRIDSQTAPEPLTSSVSGLRTRLEWAQTNIYSEHIIDRLYEECLLLDGRVRQVIEVLDGQGESSG